MKSSVANDIKLKKNPKFVKLLVIILLLFAIIASFVVIKQNETEIYTKVIYTIMPKSISSNNDNYDVDFYIELNDDFDFNDNTASPLDAFNYRYIDPDSGKEVLIEGTENAVINGNNVQVYLGFVIELQNRINEIKNIVIRVILALFSIAIVAGIVVWYKVWSKKEDEAKAKKYKAKNRAKK